MGIPPLPTFLPRPWPHRARNISTPFSLSLRLTWYSLLNSCSAKESLLSSQLSSKAVRMGSLEERAMSEGEARARYALIREREWRRLSSDREVMHSSQPHLEEKKVREKIHAGGAKLAIWPPILCARAHSGEIGPIFLFSAPPSIYTPLRRPPLSPFSNESRALPISTAEEAAPL